MTLKQLFFSKKLQKIAQRLGALPPDPNSLRMPGALPQTPVSDTFELQYTFLLNTSANLNIFTF